MEKLVHLWGAVYDWTTAQPTEIQILVALGVLAVLYFVYVTVATTLAAIYATFFK